MKKILSIILTLAITSLSFGETVKLTLEEAINMAFENSYILENAELELTNSNLQVREAYKEATAKIDYNGRYDLNENEIYSGTKTPSDEKFSHDVGLTQPLFRGGAVTAGISAARSVNKKSEYQFEDSKNNLRLMIIEKYSTILKLQESKKVLETSLKEIEEQYKRANRKYELRLIAKSEVLPLTTNLINTKTKLIETENRIRISELELMSELKMPRDTKLQLTNIENNFSMESLNLETDIKHAQENNKQAKIAKLDTKISKSQQTAARSEFMPKVDLKAGYRGEDTEFDESTKDWEWYAAVTVNMNLFSFGQDYDAYKRSSNSTKISENKETKLQDDIEVEVRTNYLDLIRLEGTIDAQTAAVEAAEENLTLEKRRYESGLTDAIDFLQIENALRESKLALIEARLDYYLAFERYQNSLK